ncbi:MAG: hypothetical protein AB7U95_25825 [Reyranella sp.]
MAAAFGLVALRTFGRLLGNSISSRSAPDERGFGFGVPAWKNVNATADEIVKLGTISGSSRPSAAQMNGPPIGGPSGDCFPG